MHVDAYRRNLMMFDLHVHQRYLHLHQRDLHLHLKRHVFTIEET